MGDVKMVKENPPLPKFIILQNHRIDFWSSCSCSNCYQPTDEVTKIWQEPNKLFCNSRKNFFLSPMSKFTQVYPPQT